VVKGKDDENEKIFDQIPIVHIEFETNLVARGLRNGMDTTRFAFNATAEDLEKIIVDLNKIKLKLNILSK